VELGERQVFESSYVKLFYHLDRIIKRFDEVVGVMYSLGPETVNRLGDEMKAFSIDQMTDGEDDLAVEREPDRVSGACPVGREELGIGAVGDHDGFRGVAAGSGGSSAESIGTSASLFRGGKSVEMGGACSGDGERGRLVRVRR